MGEFGDNSYRIIRKLPCDRAGSGYLLRCGRNRPDWAPFVPERGKMPAWNGGAGVIMMATRVSREAPAGCQVSGPFAAAMPMSTAKTKKISFPALPAATARVAVAPRMADDERKRKGEPGAPGTAVITKTKPQTKRPSMYRVLILNDDYTPMEFVVHVLERFFGKDHEAATRIMLHVHHHGIGECGIYTYEVAETKVTQVMDFARKHQHPLQCVMEKK
jgi:ATP-dependent Clp protease adaptor protein ClpS